MEAVNNYYNKIKDTVLTFYSKTLSQFIHTLWPSKVSIIFLGIDNAGKTTLLNLLKDTQTATKPTSHPTSTTIQIGKMKAIVFDLGGHTAARKIWEDYQFTCEGVVFIIDAMDEERFDIVKEAYRSVIDQMAHSKKTPVSVLINKIDLVYQAYNGNEADVRKYLDFVQQRCGVSNNDHVLVSEVSMLMNQNKEVDQKLHGSFKWLEEYIFANKQ